MKTAVLLLLALMTFLQVSPANAAGATANAAMSPIPAGEPFPDIAFKGPLTPAEAAALGLASPDKPFKAADIKAQTVILVVFSMYCPFCQKEGPELVKLQQLIKDRKLSDKVKLVGLGAGNSPFEVNVFREKFAIPFPLIPDQDFSVYKALGQVGTPYYYVLKRQGNDFVVADGQLGCMASAAAFLDGVMAKAGLKKGK